MNIKPPTPIIRAALVALIVLAVGWTGLDIPRTAIEETVDAQLSDWGQTQSGADAQSDVSSGTQAMTGTAQVTQVIDGDTVTVLLDGREEKVRFIGIDTPETEFSPAGAECYGAEATARAQELLSEKTITITGDSTQAVRDRHDRLLVYAELPTGIDFGETMVSEGLAREYTYAADYQNQAAYQTAQRVAQAAGRGLWAACNQPG